MTTNPKYQQLFEAQAEELKSLKALVQEMWRDLSHVPEVAEVRKERVYRERLAKFTTIRAMPAGDEQVAALRALPYADRKLMFSTHDCVPLLCNLPVEVQDEFLDEVLIQLRDRILVKRVQVPQYLRMTVDRNWPTARTSHQYIDKETAERFVAAGLARDVARDAADHFRYDGTLIDRNSTCFYTQAQIDLMVEVDPRLREFVARGTVTFHPMTQVECEAHVLDLWSFDHINHANTDPNIRRDVMLAKAARKAAGHADAPSTKRARRLRLAKKEPAP